MLRRSARSRSISARCAQLRLVDARDVRPHYMYLQFWIISKFSSGVYLVFCIGRVWYKQCDPFYAVPVRYQGLFQRFIHCTEFCDNVRFSISTSYYDRPRCFLNCFFICNNQIVLLWYDKIDLTSVEDIELRCFNYIRFRF